MSLSDAQRKFSGGRVIIGLQTRDLDEMNMEAGNAIRIATPETEERFLERVREKARQKAAQIITQAMQEARQIREKAREEGLSQGLAQADEEISAIKDELSSNVGKIFSNLKKEKLKIWDEHRQDMVLVLKASVDKVLGIELSENRTRVMESLMHQALELVESTKELTLAVCPEDEEVIKSLLEQAREKRPEIGSYRIKASGKIKKGGLILENGNGVVDNSIDSRFEQIRKVIAEISLSEEET